MLDRLALALALCFFPKPAAAQSPGACAVSITAGAATTNAGDGGTAAMAQLDGPQAVVQDSAGNTYIADTGNSKVRIVTPSGVIRTFAGTGQYGYSGDGGQAVGATLMRPVALAVGSSGEIYVADQDANVIRRIAADGTVSTFAGNGHGGFGGDGGPAVNALISNPQGLAFDGLGNLYISDFGNSRIRKVSPKSLISTVLGPDAPVQYFLPQLLSIDSQNNLDIVSGNNVISLTPAGQSRVVAGNSGGGPAPAEGLAATAVTLPYVTGIATDPQGNIYFASRYASYPATAPNYNYDEVWQIAANGTLHLEFQSALGWGLYRQSNGQFLRNDIAAGQIVNWRTLSAASAAYSTFAGTSYSQSIVGVASSAARFVKPSALTADSAGNVFIADAGANLILKASMGGQLTAYAGNGTTTAGPDGTPALQTPIPGPQSIAMSPSGELYFIDSLGTRVRKISTNGTVITVAGNTVAGPPLSAADSRSGVPATSVSLSITAIAVDGPGNLYIKDRYPGVWRVDSAGILHVSTTLSGTFAPANNGQVYYLTQGPGIFETQLMQFQGTLSPGPNVGDYVFESAAVDASGAVYSPDPSGRGLLKYVPGKSVGILSTSASWASATLDVQSPLLTAGGNLYFIDNSHSRIGLIASATSCTPASFPLLPMEGAFSAASYDPEVVSPGELVAIFGSGLGPSTPVTAQLTGGAFPTSVAGVQVLFNNFPAPLIYVSSSQIVAMVPWELAGQVIPNMQVLFNGIASNTAGLLGYDSDPGLFTQNGSGSGPGAILNADYTLNTASNPAARGSIVVAYGTGFGMLSPPLPSGQIAGSVLSYLPSGVTATIGNQPAQVLYSGTSPGLIDGAVQFNVAVPAALSPGSWPLVISVNTVNFQSPPVTLSVK